MSEFYTVVDPVRLKTRKVSEVDRGKFCFQPHKKHTWLQKICFAILSKLGCYATSINEIVQTYPINTGDLLAKIHAQKSEIFARCNYRPERIYIGREDFMDLMNTKDFTTHPATFPVSMELCRNGYRELMGCKLTVVPWMRGVLVVPKEGGSNE